MKKQIFLISYILTATPILALDAYNEWIISGDAYRRFGFANISHTMGSIPALPNDVLLDLQSLGFPANMPYLPSKEQLHAAFNKNTAGLNAAYDRLLKVIQQPTP